MNKNKTILSAIMIMVIISAVPLAIGADNSNSAQLINKTADTNSGTIANPLKSVTYSAGPASLAPSARILVYADDLYHAAPNTYIDQALRQLGVSYKAFYNGDFNGFNTALTTGGPWDLVIFGQEQYTLPSGTTLDNLNTYVGGGGRLIARSWQMDTYSSSSLWKTMRVVFVRDDNTGTPSPVYWWATTNPAIVGKIPQYTTYPNSPPQFTQLTGGRYSIYGQYLQPSPIGGGRVLAAYSQSLPVLVILNAAIILRTDDKTLFLGFMDGQNDADYNNNGVRDGIELWKNEISYMLKGPENFVFVRGTDNGLWYRTYDGTTWSGWVGLGGTLASDPDSATWDGKTYVFARGTDNGLWYRTFDGLHWSGWTSLGGVITSGPGAS